MKTFGDFGIDLQGKTGTEVKTTCPQCSHTRKKSTYPCLNVNTEKGLWHCWHCEYAGSLLRGEDHLSTPPARPVSWRKPVYRQTPLPARVVEWFAGRGIPENVLARRRISYGPIYMPQVEQEVSAIQFPYFRQGEIVNCKYRDGQKHFRMASGAERLLYGVDDIAGDTLLICEGECFPGDAEILTADGWCRFDRYTGGQVAQYHADGSLSMAHPWARIQKPFVGELVRHSNTRRFVACCTPDHQMVAVDVKGRLRKHDAKHRISESDVIPRVGLLDGPGIRLSDDQIALCLAVSADASIRTTGRYKGPYAVFGFKKTRKIERLRSLLKRLDITASDNPIKGGYTSICFYLPEWCAHRELPHGWLAQLSKTQRLFILEEMVHWDGNSVPQRQQTEYSTKIYANAVWMQTIAHTAGMISTIMSRENAIGKWFKVSVLHAAHSTSWQGIETKTVPYEGDVYCVTMPSGMLMVRQEGCIYVSGNCDAMALEVAGFTSVVSVPDGAPAVTAKHYETKFDFLRSAEDVLRPIKRLILAVDSDAPGEKLAEELARRLGPERCYRVQWSSECKDANDVLISHGAAVLRECIEAAQPWPVSGVISPAMLAASLAHIYTSGMERGLDPGWPILAKHYTVRAGEMTIVTGVPSHGKALSLDCPLPTPTGWTTMGNIQVGEWLFDEQGQPCQVVAATDVMWGHSCYQVEFSDGTTIVADAGHQWLTHTEKARRSARVARKNRRLSPRPLAPHGTDQSTKRTFPSVVTTEEMSQTLVARGKFNHAIAVTQPCELPEIPLSIPPYVLGVWLGDGFTSSGGYSKPDYEITTSIRAEGYVVTDRADPDIHGIVGLLPQLRQLGLIGNKHIPTSYLRASAAQRMGLLQGLCDTDGHITPYGRVEFCSTSAALAHGVYELAASLGFRPVLLEDRARLNGEDYGPRYRVTFTPDRPVFRLERKRRYCKTSAPKSQHRYVVAVKPVASVPVRCVQVNSPSHLYLASRAFIPTHNSAWLSALVINLARLHHWGFAIFSPENYPLERYAASLLEQQCGKPFDGDGRMSREEMETGLRWLNEYISFLMPEDDNPTIDRLLDLAAIQVYRQGIKGLVLDPWNEIEHSRPAGQTETEYISHALTKIRRFARHHGVHVWVVAHPTKLRKAESGTYEGQYPPPTPYDINGSANWRNKADNCITIWRNVDANDNCVQVHIQKIRFREIGKPGGVMLVFDPYCGRFSEPPVQEVSRWSA